MEEIHSTVPKVPGEKKFRLTDETHAQKNQRKSAQQRARRQAAISAGDPKVNRVRAADTKRKKIARTKIQNMEAAGQEIQTRLVAVE
jgi:hypothetical protein